jgi:hypothetical protein
LGFAKFAAAPGLLEPVGGHVPYRPGRLFVGLSAGHADIVKRCLVKFAQVFALTLDGAKVANDAQERDTRCTMIPRCRLCFGIAGHIAFLLLEMDVEKLFSVSLMNC